MSSLSVPSWASSEVAACKFGDARLLSRSAFLLSVMARRFGGTVTRVFRTVASREGAYRFLENESVDQESLLAGAALFVLGLVRTSFFFVVLDFCFLRLPGAPNRELGQVGHTRCPAFGLVAMSALALSPSGSTLGLVDQQLFARPKPRPRGPSHCSHCRKRKRKRKCKQASKSRKRCAHQQEKVKALPLAQKETRYWMLSLMAVLTRCQALSLRSRPWFQCDRGADFFELLTYAVAQKLWLTVRANSDRRLSQGQTVRRFLKSQPVLYCRTLLIPAGPNRKAREAQLVVRATRVQVTHQRWPKEKPELGVVWVREVGPVPRGSKRLDWLLWTTHPLRRKGEVKEVVRGYEYRWAIEEFHKTWKSVGQVERTQLKSQRALKVWATLLAMVAARAQRLVKRARSEPETDPNSELSEDELTALRLVLERKGGKTPKLQTLALVVDAIARLGGYTGKSSGGPPGTITVARGLEDLALIVATISVLRASGRLQM